jgi:hypothetical protein
MTGGCREQQYEELNDLYASPSIIRMNWNAARMWEKNDYRLLVGLPAGKTPLERPRQRWVDNIKMEFGEMGCGDVDWIGLAQDRNR